MLGSITAYRSLLKKAISKEIFKNISYLTIGTGLSQLLSLAAVLKVTDILAPNEYGLFTFMAAQGLLLFTVSNLGTSSIFVRSVARNPSMSNDLVFNGIFLQSAALVAFAFLYCIYNYYWGSLTLTQLLLVFMFTFVSCLNNLSENVFHGNQKMLVPSVINLTYSLAWFITVYILTSFNTHINFIFFIFFLLNGLKATSSIILLRSQGLLIGHINNFWISSIRFMKESWPYFVMVLIMLPVTRLSNNFLVLNANIDEVGYFNLAQRLLLPVSMVVGILFTVIFPGLSVLWKENEQRFYRIVSFGFRYFMIVTLILCFLFNLYAKEMIVTLFPAQYFPAIEVCKSQIWYLFLTSIDSLIGTILGSINKEKLILRFGVIYSICCTPVFLYGSKFGALGLSYGYVISFAICLIYVWHTFMKTLKIKIQHSNYYWLLAIGLFLVSRLIPYDFSFYYKLILTLSLLAGSAFYISKTYTSLNGRL